MYLSLCVCLSGKREEQDSSKTFYGSNIAKASGKMLGVKQQQQRQSAALDLSKWPEDDRFFMNRMQSIQDMLNNISSELDFMLKDLKKNDTFTPNSPKSPLNATNATVPFENTTRTFSKSSRLANEPTYSIAEENLCLQLPPKTSTGRHTSGASPSPTAGPLSPQPPPCQQPPSIASPPPQPPPSTEALMAEFCPTLEDNALTVMTRLVHTKPLWFLPSTQRAAAAHYLQRQPVGTFVVRQVRQKDRLSLTLKHPGTGKGPYIESYPIEGAVEGVKLAVEDMVFSTVDELIAYHIHAEGGLPCQLALPLAVMAARNLREIQSLALLEKDFWTSVHSKSPTKTTKQDLFLLDPPRVMPAVLSLPSYQKPALNQSLSEGAPTRTKPIDDNSGVPSANIAVNSRENTPATCGVYGIITGPPVIYENADTENTFFQKRPRSLDGLTGFAWGDKRISSGFMGAGYRGSQRPPSEFDRQDMRFSSASEFDFVTSTTEQRYPPPNCAPPPPPTDVESLDVYMMPSVPGKYTWSMVRPLSDGVEYSQPYDQPPLPPKRSATAATAYGKPQPTQQPVRAVPAGYGQPTTGSQAWGMPVLSASQPVSGSVHNWQQQQQQQQQALLTQPMPNYSAPPPPATASSAWVAVTTADSLWFSGAAAAAQQQQIQNILQPAQPGSGDSTARTALPEFDPLCAGATTTTTTAAEAASAYSRPQTHAQAPSSAAVPHSNPQSDETLMRDYTLHNLQYGIGAVTLSDTYRSPPSSPISTIVNNNNSQASCKMAPLPSLATRTPCDVKGSPLIGGHDIEPFILEHHHQTMPSPAFRSDSFDDSLDNSSDSDLDDMSSPSAGIPYTENQNGNHLVLSQSVSIGERSEDSEFEQSREGEKKDYKRNRSGRSHFDKFKVLAKKKSRGAKEHINRALSKKNKKRDPQEDIQDAISRVADNKNIGLGALIHSFIRTQEEKCETDKPEIVLRSIRQFMSGTKNYLLNKREPEIDVIIDKHMGELDLASLEAIIEGALHQCVLAPLKSDIGMSCINEYNRNGNMRLMDENFLQAKTKTPEELGIKANYVPPQGDDLQEIQRLFSQLEQAYSPLRKLDLLLQIVSAIYNSVRDKNTGRDVTNSMGADDFLPMLIYVLVQCDMMSIEIEADYMWGLLDPSMLSGEGGYYLTTLSSAICVLKQFEEETSTETQGFLTVLAAASPDPTCISLKTLPVLPGMMASEVCRILAHRLSITDMEAEHYRLFLLRDAQEVRVEDHESPLKIKNDEEAGGVRGCRFGFRSTYNMVLWPKTSGVL